MGRLLFVVIVFVAGAFVSAYLLGHESSEVIDLAPDKIEGFLEEVTVPEPLSPGTTPTPTPSTPSASGLEVFNTSPLGLRVRNMTSIWRNGSRNLVPSAVR